MADTRSVQSLEAESSSGRSPSLSELVGQLSEQAGRLARLEVELARAELTDKARQAGVGAGMFGGAGAFALCALGTAAACAVLALATTLSAWLSALIVCVACVVIAAVLALIGRSRIRAASPPVPEEAIDSSKEDIAWAKTRARSASR